MNTYVVDTECYPDLWLLSFMNVKTREVEHVYIQPGRTAIAWKLVRKKLKTNRIVTFNGNHYDLPMISLALAGFDNKDLKQANDHIILNGKRPWEVARAFEVPQFNLPNHIDLMGVAPGMASLKIYAGRIHAPVLQDLPIKPDEKVGKRLQMVLDYCEHDLEDTRLLFKRLLPQLKLRQQLTKQYGQDLMSKSDAQIAEAVIGSELAEALGHEIRRPEFKSGLLKYKAPDFIKFMDDDLKTLVKEIAADDFVIADGSGKVKLPPTLSRRSIPIGDSNYRMGIGGLHSMEKSRATEPDDDEFLLDFDVTSYYPSIILGCGLYPKHLGPKFLKVYDEIVQQRLEAKRTKDKVKSDTLKITINGSFGKFGSRYSILFSPDLLIQTTITGQLSLLMLISGIEDCGGTVVSANTDGIVVRVKKKTMYKRVKSAIRAWETITGFKIEETQYTAAYFRDVNNYIALKPDGTHKAKGIFVKPGLAKNPTTPICAKAVVDYLQKDIPIYDTIMNHEDVRDFISIRKVRGGAQWTNDKQKTFELGRAIRWYYSVSEKGAFHYALNGNKVPKTDGARPLMTLGKRVPRDLDRQWYIMEAETMLGQIGKGLV